MKKNLSKPRSESWCFGKVTIFSHILVLNPTNQLMAHSHKFKSNFICIFNYSRHRHPAFVNLIITVVHLVMQLSWKEKPRFQKFLICKTTYKVGCKYNIYSKWLLINSNWAILQLCYGKNKFYFYRMMMKSGLY